jgi:predicted NBD/HSP70 family sugar kinase
VIIAVDIRPVQSTVALADANGKFISQEMFLTPPDPQPGMEALLQSIERIIAANRNKKIEGIGISVPGRYDQESDRLVFAPNLKWRDVDLRSPIAKATGLEVEVENAANACVLAAVWFDHMQDSNLVAVTVSEGIGIGIWANRQLVRGHNGMAGEFGHVPLDPSGPPCGCGGHGCWEVYASNRAAIRYYIELGGSLPGGHSGLSFGDLLLRATQGDTRAAQALEKMAHYLGRGMRMLVASVAPSAIVVIGDLTRSWYRFGPIIEAEVQAQVLAGGITPRLIPAHEDGMARLRGTVALILQKDFGTLQEAAG